MNSVPVAIMKYSDLAALEARNISLTARVPTVDSNTGLPPLRALKANGSEPSEKYQKT